MTAARNTERNSSVCVCCYLLCSSAQPSFAESNLQLITWFLHPTPRHSHLGQADWLLGPLTRLPSHAHIPPILTWSPREKKIKRKKKCAVCARSLDVALYLPVGKIPELRKSLFQTTVQIPPALEQLSTGLITTPPSPRRGSSGHTLNSRFPQTLNSSE